ncbi:hypothetical protein VH441_03790 [Psychrobacter sp. HD31]|uniref:hypothetical protein n=1 Tax=Psychrobacter sp. HD31 TaxID=3112003 RepID=UPI003DA53ECA
MIVFENKESWNQFGQKRSENSDNIIINLKQCKLEDDFLIAIGNNLRASYSTDIQIGKNLDALHDIVSDWFIEQWNNWKDVYIVGWLEFVNKYPVFSQKVLLVLNDSYLTSLTAQMCEVVQWQTMNLKEANFFDAMYESPPNIYLIMN